MTTPERFLEIIENHSILKENGDIVIEFEDAAMESEYIEFLMEHAVKEEEMITAEDINGSCPKVNGVCRPN